jgi:RNA polymerase sigma-70 factor (ECF subfamily)
MIVTTARNLILDQIRRANRTPVSIDPGVIDQFAKPRDEAIGEADEPLQRLADAIEKLNDEHRQIIQWLYLDGLSIDEAADRLRIGKWAIYKRHERALRKLQMAMSKTPANGSRP